MPEPTASTPREATACFLGDVRLLSGRADSLLSPDVQAAFSAHDIRCVNFEGAAHHAPAVTRKKAGPALLQGETAASRVIAAGVNLVTLANNHAMDYGAEGLRATLAAFGGASVPCIGAGLSASLANAPFVVTVNGVKLGFLAFTERQYGTLAGEPSMGDGKGEGAGTAWINGSGVLNSIRFLRAQCNHVIVLAHAGLEEVSQPLPGWRALYRRFADAGASVVVGSHPHVPQGWERYKNALLFYSLGNAAWEPASDFPDARSLLLSLTLPRNGVPSFTLKTVVYDASAGQLFFAPHESAAPLDAMLAAQNAVLLDGARYRAEVRRICLSFYEQIALPDFFTVTGSLPGGGFQRVKNAAKQVLRKPALNAPLLLSMLENESYRWAVEEALRAAADAANG